MKKVTVVNHVNGLRYGQISEDPTEWITQCEALGLWGKPERWVEEFEEDVSGALETTVDIGPLGERTLYRLPAQYTISIEDVTAEFQMRDAVRQAQLDAALRLQTFPAEIDAASTLEELKAKVKTLVQDIVVLLQR